MSGSEYAPPPCWPSGLFSVVYADPPWRYGMRKWGKDTIMGSRGSDTRLNYDTMTQADMESLPVHSIAAATSLCFMWATFPTLPDAIALMKAWGFTYKTAAFVWVKKTKRDKVFWGMGAYTRANAEVVLLGTMGNNTALIQRHDVHQVVFAPVAGHSQKPDEVRDRIVRLCGDVPRVELFARERVQGWEAWGNEVEANPAFEPTAARPGPSVGSKGNVGLREMDT